MQGIWLAHATLGSCRPVIKKNLLVDDEPNVHEGRYAHHIAGIARQRDTRHWYVCARQVSGESWNKIVPFGPCESQSCTLSASLSVVKIQDKVFYIQ
jgi:hypothetical protein